MSGDFYKMDPAAWDFGTHALSLEEEAAYLRIVNATHKHRAAVPASDRVLAGMLRCSPRKARALLDALVKAGKVRVEAGLIVNDRAISDLVRRGFVSSSRAESGAKGGRTRAERAAKARENKETPEANASSREEKRREEYSVANATDGDAVAERLPTVEVNLISKAVWDAGKPFLASRGVANPGAMIGRWLKSHPPLALLQAIEAAQRAGTHDPIPYITEALKGTHHGKRPSAAADRIRRVAARFEAAERGMAGDAG